ncbi:hypothetical protein BDR07DRAFT_1488538 [Suillus spraguei]|nr:hypothetical protein BDR07DRAFT_1488538 [Suillus spraguei]
MSTSQATELTYWTGRSRRVMFMTGEELIEAVAALVYCDRYTNNKRRNYDTINHPHIPFSQPPSASSPHSLYFLFPPAASSSLDLYLEPPSSTIHSPTHTRVDTTSVLSGSKPAKSDFSIENHVTRTPSPNTNGYENPSDSHLLLQVNGDVPKIKLVQDGLVNPRPFKFGPAKLASSLDPKNLDTLEALGGIDGPLDGLGTDRSWGFTPVDTPDNRSCAGVGASRRHNREP